MKRPAVLCLAVLLGLVACSGDGRPAESAAAASVVVTIPNLSFTPAIVSLPAGGTVTWQFTDNRTVHNVTLAGGPASGDREAGASFSHVFTRRGNYRYECTLHPTMQGLIRVTAHSGGATDAGLPFVDDGPRLDAARLSAGDLPAGFHGFESGAVQRNEPVCPDQHPEPLPAARLERRSAFRRGELAIVHEVAEHSGAEARQYLDELWDRVRSCPGWSARSGSGSIRIEGTLRRDTGPHGRTITFELGYNARGRAHHASVMVAQHLGVVSTLIVYGRWPATERNLVLARLTRRLSEAAEGVRT